MKTPKDATFLFRLESELLAQLRKRARELGIPVAELIRRAAEKAAA